MVSSPSDGPISRVLLLLLPLWMSAAAAADAAARSAQPSASPKPVIFALIIGNNRSQSDARADLRYADDDALKYAAVWRPLTDEGHLKVLTALDKDTAAYDDSPVDGLATRASVMASAKSLGAAIRQAEAAGQRTEVYVVFAGHGDVHNGKGMPELQDGVLTSEDLKGVLDTIGAGTTHVLLDSCNSFFVLYPRRPGGRIIASSDDLTGGLVLQKGKLGVFLSMSSEAQVYDGPSSRRASSAMWCARRCLAPPMQIRMAPSPIAS